MLFLASGFLQYYRVLPGSRFIRQMVLYCFSLGFSLEAYLYYIQSKLSIHWLGGPTNGRVCLIDFKMDWFSVACEIMISERNAFKPESYRDIGST